MRYSLIGFLCSLALSAAASDQGTFEEFEKSEAEARANSISDEELAQFEAVLNGRDIERALRAMRFMLESGKPRLVRAAREFGLLSTEPLIQHEALKAVFDQGGPFRFEVDLTTADEKDSRARSWIQRNRGSISVDGRTGYWTFSLGEYRSDHQCWVWRGDDDCSIMLSGVTIDIKHWRSAAGHLKLNESGALVGSFRNTNGGEVWVPAMIRLLD